MIVDPCPTELRPRQFGKRDLWCPKHYMWVYERVDSWQYNERHQAARGLMT